MSLAGQRVTHPVIDLTVSSPPYSPQQFDDGEYDWNVEAIPPDLDQLKEEVLAVVPDVEATYLTDLLESQIEMLGTGVVAWAVSHLLDSSNYPKTALKNKGKRKASPEGSERPARKIKIDYASKDRHHEGGEHYERCAIAYLRDDYPYIPRRSLLSILYQNNMLYVPTFIRLREYQARHESNRPYILNKTPHKGKSKVSDGTDPALEEERHWLLNVYLESEARSASQTSRTSDNQTANESLADCGCCYGEYSESTMTDCPAGHRFCGTCMANYAKTMVGSRKIDMVCMDTSDCKLPFSEQQLMKCMDPKLGALYQRVKLDKELKEAGLENLEDCPHCEYKCIIENDQERLFRCENEDCSAITCRTCKLPDHLPLTCLEAKRDGKLLDARHIVEEAMTKAMTRNCPKCKQPFVKDYGCNKMVCTNCRTMSCYVCRATITGYDHFDQQGMNHPNVLPRNPMPGPNKCALNEDVSTLHNRETEKAYDDAIAQFIRDYPEYSVAELMEKTKDLKESRPPAGIVRPPHPQPYAHMAHQRAPAYHPYPMHRRY